MGGGGRRRWWWRVGVGVAGSNCGGRALISCTAVVRWGLGLGAGRRGGFSWG